jgi:hypothetical protein
LENLRVRVPAGAAAAADFIKIRGFDEAQGFRPANEPRRGLFSRHYYTPYDPKVFNFFQKMIDKTRAEVYHYVMIKHSLNR